MASTLNTDVEGSGEILRITATPAQGHRAIAFGPQGTIEQESSGALPTPYQVERAGGQDRRMLALTFDGRPDAEWTQEISEVLESARTPGTIFAVGEDARATPGLV